MPARLSPRHFQLSSPAGDRELFRAYVDWGDPAAFADLAHRYLGLARRAASDVCPGAADDAAQATLTLLSRKAALLARRESAAGWVFETARRLAMKARTAAARRTRHEAHATPPISPPDPLDMLSFGEVRAAVAEEVARFHDDLRLPLVLCYWDGASHVTAARRLKCSVSTLKRRLDAGRERLAARLARRGFAGSAVLAVFTALSCRISQGSVARESVAGPVKGSVQPMGQVLRTTHSLKPALLTVAAATFVAVVGLALGLSSAGDPPPPSKDLKSSEVAKNSDPVVDAFGDPLPPGAVARLGTVRFRTSEFPKHVVASPDGKRLVTTASMQHVRLAIWEAETGRPLREVEVPGLAYPEAVCWPPDGRGRAAFKVGRKDYVVWEFTDPDAKPPVGDGYLTAGPGSFSVSAFSPDGTLIAGGERAGDQGTAGKLQVWPVHPGRPVREATPQFTVDRPDGFVALSFTADGKQLVGITQGRQPSRTIAGVAGGPPPRIEPGAMADIAHVFVWHVATGKETAAFDIKADGFGVDSMSRFARMAVSPDGKSLYVPTLDAHVKAFDLGTGKERFDVLAFGPPGDATKAALPGLKSQVGELAITPDGKTVIVAEIMGRTAGLDAITGKVLWRGGREMDSTYGITVFPDGKRFALGHGARLVGVYDTATGKPLVESAGHRGGVSAVGFTADGRTALTAGWDNAFFRWDLATGRMTGQVEAEGKVRASAFTPDGKLAIDRRGLFDTTTGKLVTPLSVESLAPVAWMADGSFVVADRENSATRYAANGKKLLTYTAAPPGKPGTGPQVASVAAAADGKTVVLTGEGAATHGGMMRSDTGWVAVFNAATGTKVREWESKGTGGFTSAAFLPDGSRVVLGRRVSPSIRPLNPAEAAIDLTTALVLFNPATGEQCTPLDAPNLAARDRWVRSVAVSPTGAQFAAVEWDNSLTVYETASGAIRRRLPGHRGMVEGLTFTPDGRRLVSVSTDGTGLVWDAMPPRPTAPVALSDVERQRRWATLLKADALAAQIAMGELADDPLATVSFVKAHLKATPAPTSADLDRLIAQLGAGKFTDREAAARDLDQFGTLAVSKVRAKHPAVTSAEARQRLDEFLKSHDRPGRLTGYRLREIRAVELLETINTIESRELLRALSVGETPLARDALAPMRRLKPK